MATRLFVIPRGSEVPTLTGPATDKGLMYIQPPPLPPLNQGTIGLIKNGPDRKLKCDLCICLPAKANDEPWTFPLGIDDFIDYRVTDEAQENVLVQAFLPAPSETAPLTDGSKVFRAGRYGVYEAPFPGSISFDVADKPILRKVVVSWTINPKYGEGGLFVFLLVNGADHGIIPVSIWDLLV